MSRKDKITKRVTTFSEDRYFTRKLVSKIINDIESIDYPSDYVNEVKTIDLDTKCLTAMETKILVRQKSKSIFA